MSKIFSSLQVLKVEQESVKLQLGFQYDLIVMPFVKIILLVMDSRDLGVFQAMLYIKDELAIYKKSDAPLFFAAAVVEIVEQTYFVGFRNIEIK